MKKYSLLLILIAFLYCCKTEKKPIEPKKVKTEGQHIITNSDSVAYWKMDSLKSKDLEFMTSISKVKKTFGIKEGRLFNKIIKEYVNNVTIHFRRSYEIGEDVPILRGLPTNFYYRSVNIRRDWRFFKYDNNGNLDGVFSVDAYDTVFIKGNGYWKDFYHTDQNEIQTRKDLILKEEGAVRNNYKHGAWKYYDKNGILSETKEYKAVDSVDVRFPHCIFNKNEPCF